MQNYHVEQMFLFDPPQPRRCVFCHDDILSVLTKAHHYQKRVRLENQQQADTDKIYDLCWSCHYGLLHAGVINIEDVRRAAEDTAARIRKVTHDEVYRQIKAKIDAGERKVDWQSGLHGLTKEEFYERLRLRRRRRIQEQDTAHIKMF